MFNKDSVDYWPRDINFSDDDECENTLKKIQEDSSFSSIYTYLWNSVPRAHEAVTAMDSRLAECSLLLKNHASKIFEWKSSITEPSLLKEPEECHTFLRNYYKKRKIMLSDEMKTEKNIEGCNFTGFKINELTQLPRHLDAERIYLFILKTHNFDERALKVWKTHFLSEASIALLHDSFWWWFLYKFKPDRANQDCLFDRISESYVTLFMSIPLNRKDAFFQMYPDCLTQAVYATFLEAFPESCNLFNDEFKEELGNNIFLWLSGLKPQKCFWTHWKLDNLSTTTIHGSKKTPRKSIQEKLASSQQRILATIDFDMVKVLRDPRANGKSLSKDEPRLPKLITKSHYSGYGPEFEKVLFNTGGQSPLILYFLEMNKFGDLGKAPKKSMMKFTEIVREPPPAPTYQDIIKEATKQFAKNRKEFMTEKYRSDEDIKYLKKQQERIDKQLIRLQAKVIKQPHEAKQDFEKFLHKLRTEAHMERELVSRSSSSSLSSLSSASASSTITTEDMSEEAEG
ncbi:protein FAM227B [Otolemur garnettii]|uniref:protein FAM227B n=1 Tax=Otolemur garnettii TaxID=30611 RepID=UPI000C7F2B61|nr:protein FAM227B [Otolemur garnettii]